MNNSAVSKPSLPDAVSELLVSEKDGLLCVSLNRPTRGNALSASLVESLIQVLENYEQGPQACLLLTGEGKTFCSGFDLQGLDALSDGDLLLRFVRIEELLQRLYCCPKPVAVATHGATMGAGADIFAVAQYRIAAQNAYFAFPGIRFGLVLGTRRLAALVGANQAADIIQHGRRLDSHGALDCRLANIAAQPEAWIPALQEQLSRRVILSDATASVLGQALGRSRSAADLADLVQSASQPSLKRRIQAYVNSLKEK